MEAGIRPSGRWMGIPATCVSCSDRSSWLGWKLNSYFHSGEGFDAWIKLNVRFTARQIERTGPGAPADWHLFLPRHWHRFMLWRPIPTIFFQNYPKCFKNLFISHRVQSILFFEIRKNESILTLKFSEPISTIFIKNGTKCFKNLFISHRVQSIPFFEIRKIKSIPVWKFSEPISTIFIINTQKYSKMLQKCFKNASKNSLFSTGFNRF